MKLTIELDDIAASELSFETKHELVEYLFVNGEIDKDQYRKLHDVFIPREPTHARTPPAA